MVIPALIAMVITSRQTARGIETRKLEHMNAFKGKGYSRIAEHCIKLKHKNDWNGDTLAVESNDTKRHIKESLLMDMMNKKNKTVYSQKSFELKVF